MDNTNPYLPATFTEFVGDDAARVPKLLRDAFLAAMYGNRTSYDFVATRIGDLTPAMRLGFAHFPNIYPHFRSSAQGNSGNSITSALVSDNIASSAPPSSFGSLPSHGYNSNFADLGFAPRSAVPSGNSLTFRNTALLASANVQGNAQQRMFNPQFASANFASQDVRNRLGPHPNLQQKRRRKETLADRIGKAENGDQKSIAYLAHHFHKNTYAKIPLARHLFERIKLVVQNNPNVIRTDATPALEDSLDDFDPEAPYNGIELLDDAAQQKDNDKKPQ